MKSPFDRDGMTNLILWDGVQNICQFLYHSLCYSDPIYTLEVVDDYLLATGDDDGVVKVIY